MVAVDSSAFITFLKDENKAMADEVEYLLERSSLVLPPAALAELLSSPKLPYELAERILSIPVLHVTDCYWQRVGRMRADILRRGLKSRLADAMIAQSCIDYGVPLFTCDSDFRHYESYHKLKLYNR